MSKGAGMCCRWTSSSELESCRGAGRRRGQPERLAHPKVSGTTRTRLGEKSHHLVPSGVMHHKQRVALEPALLAAVQHLQRRTAEWARAQLGLVRMSKVWLWIRALRHLRGAPSPANASPPAPQSGGQPPAGPSVPPWCGRCPRCAPPAMRRAHTSSSVCLTRTRHWRAGRQASWPEPARMPAGMASFKAPTVCFGSKASVSSSLCSDPVAPSGALAYALAGLLSS
jgi:hypothetical protein